MFCADYGDGVISIRLHNRLQSSITLHQEETLSYSRPGLLADRLGQFAESRLLFYNMLHVHTQEFISRIHEYSHHQEFITHTSGRLPNLANRP